MGPAYFVIAILGCADGGTACAPVANLPARYATQEQCVAAAGAALLENSDYDYPTLLARCRPETDKSAEAQERLHDKRRRA